MTDRLEKELALLRRYYPDLQYLEQPGMLWVLIQNYPVPAGIWNRDKTNICFEVNESTYPGAAPYGFYVPAC